MAKGKNRGGQSLLRQNFKVDEPSRIRISRILQNFRASNDLVYNFEASLSKNERALVHQISLQMGMKSKSSGKSKNRRVSVFKSKRKVDTVSGSELFPYFTFSEEAQEILGGLFTHYPPGNEDLREEMIGEHRRKTGKPMQRKDDTFCKPYMRKDEIREKLEEYASSMKKDYFSKISEERSKLPIAAYKDAITSAIESHQVVLISGETGCGKTTQVPQYILDHMWHKGEVCKVVCTQPRRISAISVAERIANERGETIGNSIGYKIRLESRGGRNTSVMLCTTGILLRLLVSSYKGTSISRTGTMEDDKLEITHIIMDEIHERDRYSDFTMAIIRDMLPFHPHLRLILMSATIDTERFSKYFGGCPIILVPGFTYPVRTFYLEDVLSIIKSRGKNHLVSAKLSDADNHDAKFTDVDNHDAKLTDDDNQELSEEDKLSLDEAINLAWSNDDWDPLLELVSSKGSPKIFDYQHSLTGLTPLMVFAGKGRVGDMCMLLSLGADPQLRAKDGTTALEIAKLEDQQEAVEILKIHGDNASSNSKDNASSNSRNNVSSNSVERQMLLDKYLASVNPELVDLVLIEQLLQKICIDSKEGGILVFLPGWDEINKTRARLLESPFFNETPCIVISLHSMIPAAEQRKAFWHPPHGCRKIVLSTNIAETAVTIDDIVYVIDSGRMKEKSYDPYNNVSTLQSSWISKASAKQRQGRAGRCQPGICYHLYSKLRAASFPDFQVPEIRRISIEELCLQVKMIDPSCRVQEFLSKTLDPPVFESIRNAIVALQDIGALSHDENLTELGEKLGALPVHPLTSKMLFFAILMNCLDPALTLACASDYRDPFTIPMSFLERKSAAASKAELASLYGGCGDQLAVIAAFECWNNAKKMGLEGRFCSEYFVSQSAMHMLNGMRKQLQNELIRSGLIDEDVSRYNVNAHDPGVLHAVLVAGLYPMVGTLALTPQARSGKRVLVETAGGSTVHLLSHSTNSRLPFIKDVARPLVVFDEITRGDGGMNIRNCSLIGALPLLLLAAEIAVAPPPGGDNNNDDDEASDSDGQTEDGDGIEVDEKSSEPSQGNKSCQDEKKPSQQSEDKLMSSPDNIVRVIVDRWLFFASSALDVAQLYCLRERLSAAILHKVTYPGEPLPATLWASIFAISRILSSDGLSGMPQMLDPVERQEPVERQAQTEVFPPFPSSAHPPPSSPIRRNPPNPPSSIRRNPPNPPSSIRRNPPRQCRVPRIPNV